MSKRERPVCPNLDEITEDREAILKALRSFGVDASIIKQPDQIVYEILVKLWENAKITKKAPVTIDIANKCKLRYSNVQAVLTRLENSGKLIKLKRGVYIPKR